MIDAETLLIQLLAVPGKSGGEAAVARFIVDQLQAAGLPGAAIRFDTAHRKSIQGGETGNLIVRLPGSGAWRRAPRRMLVAHMDTVPLCVGCKPLMGRGRIVSADPATALGGDNRTGCAVLLVTALALLESDVPRPPLTFLWTVQEEVGLQGARHVSKRLLGSPAMAFNFDGGHPGDVVIGATGAYRMTINIQGVAAHAGVHPERGVSASAIAALAIADLQRGGWHGVIEKGRQRGTSNVGVLCGGEATNVVTESVLVRAEARSHQPAFRRRIVQAYQRAFEAAAKQVRNENGDRGRVQFEVRDDYESFKLDRREPVVNAAAEALGRQGLEPNLRVINGGLDANWLVAHGIPAVTLGCGQHNIHTVGEYIDVREFRAACGVAMDLATPGT